MFVVGNAYPRSYPFAFYSSRPWLYGSGLCQVVTKPVERVKKRHFSALVVFVATSSLGLDDKTMPQRRFLLCREEFSMRGSQCSPLSNALLVSPRQWRDESANCRSFPFAVLSRTCSRHECSGEMGKRLLVTSCLANFYAGTRVESPDLVSPQPGWSLLPPTHNPCLRGPREVCKDAIIYSAYCTNDSASCQPARKLIVGLVAPAEVALV